MPTNATRFHLLLQRQAVAEAINSTVGHLLNDAADVGCKLGCKVGAAVKVGPSLGRLEGDSDKVGTPEIDGFADMLGASDGVEEGIAVVEGLMLGWPEGPPVNVSIHKDSFSIQGSLGD